MQFVKKITIIISVCAFFFSSCRKKKEEVDPQFFETKCSLLTIDNVDGQNLQSYEYVEGKLTRIYSKDSIPTILEFRYNSKNQVERMNIITDGSNENYRVNYTYDANGNVSKTTASLAGYDFMTNDFVYTDNRITAVTTTVKLFGRSVEGNTRLEYLENNVSKVYASINGEPEVLAFAGDSYDSNPQYTPSVFKVAALGFVGIANNFFSYLGRNNLIAGRIYDEKGIVDQKMQFQFTYDENKLPMISEAQIEQRGKKISRTTILKYECP